MKTLIRNQRSNGWLDQSREFSSPFTLLDEMLGGSIFPSGQFTSTNVPAVNISEQKDKYSVELSAPGFAKENFKVEVLDGNLVVSAEKKEEIKTEDKKFSRREFNYGSFRRTFQLAEDVQDDRIAASYENGILNISIPKKEEEKPAPAREIKIS